jgi:tetratricopeptide (TPR) repeat protein
MGTVFISYSSEQSEAATRIELSLREDGHNVFRDRSSLSPGESFDARIRAAVEASDLFIFLISRESVLPGRYTLTELKFAEQKWGHPAGHVLPVLLEPVPKEAIPAFLRAVTMLNPQGNVTAEVAAEVARLSAPWWRRMLDPRRLVPAVVVVALILAAGAWTGLSQYRERREQAAQAGALTKQAQLLGDAGNYAGAWEVLERANATAPGSSEVSDARERLGMEWLENARSTQVNGTQLGLTLKDIADKVLPVLSRGATANKGQRSADLLAHMGWADFLRSRSGVGGLDPAQYYRRAIGIDAKNAFAHVMWGFEILRKNGPLAEAKQHFAIALESERKREYVRSTQIFGLLWGREPELENEAIRVANEIRRKGETMPVGFPDSPLRWRLWNIYYDRFIRGDDRPQFLAALPPADHLATFRWLYPVDQVPKDKERLYLHMLAQLQELDGDRDGALASYRRVQMDLKKDGNPSGRMVDDLNVAIKRLSR